MSERCETLCLDLPRAEEVRSRLLSPPGAQEIATASKALSDPTRITIAAALLDGGELCVCDMAWIVARPQNLVSHHLRTLRAAGLAGSRRDGKLVMYQLTDRGAQLLHSLLQPTEARR